MTVSPPLNPVLMVLEGSGSLAGRDRAGAFTATGSGALRYAAAPGARTNLLHNSRAALALSPWTNHSAATVNRVLDPAFVGGTALEFVSTTDGTGLTYSTTTATRTYDASPITVSFDAYCVSGNNRIWYHGLSRNAAGTLLGVDNRFPVTITGAVARYSVTFTPEPGAYAITPRFTSDLVNGSGPGTIRISNILVESGAVAHAYFDSGIWLDPLTGQIGTAYASPSVSRAVFWVEEATTNLVFDPTFDGASSGATWGTSTRTVDTTAAYLGTKSLKVDVTAGGGVGGFTCNSASGLGYTGTARTFIGSVYVKGGAGLTVNVRTRIEYTDLSNDQTISAAIPLTAAWQRLIAPTATSNPAKTVASIRVVVQTDVAQTGTFWMDCAQIEEKAYATSYCDGSLGTGYTWAGTAHASASSRAISTINFPVANRALMAQGEMVQRVRRDIKNFTGGTALRIPATTASVSFNISSAERWRLGAGGTAGASSELTELVAGQVRKFFGNWDGSVVSFYDGVTKLDGPDAYSGLGTDDPAGLIQIGSFGSASSANGIIGPTITYDQPLSDARRAIVNAAIASNGATDLWTLFEEWETTLSPFDLFDLETADGGVGVAASLSPANLLALQPGVAGAGVSALIDPLDFGLDYEDVRGTSAIPLPDTVAWENAPAPLVTWEIP